MFSDNSSEMGLSTYHVSSFVDDAGLIKLYYLISGPINDTRATEKAVLHVKMITLQANL